MMNARRFASFLALILTTSATALHAQTTAKIEPRVLVIATYETGKDVGDTPGELQYWAEREGLNHTIPVAGLEHPLLTNGHGLYAMISGVTSRSALTLMALAFDERFDLSHTYILLCGIGGADARATSLGSAVWIRRIVDGDPAYEIDSREMPSKWPYGTIALGVTEPGKFPAEIENTPAAGLSEESAGGVGHVAFTLNPRLVDWAYQNTRQLTLADNHAMAQERARFSASPASIKPPAVMLGDSMGSDHFWHGALMTRWAEEWLRGYTGGKGQLTISDCEDQGIALAVEKLGQLHKLDAQRFLVLRTASNYTEQAPGVTAERSLFDGLVTSSGYLPALDAAQKVGSVVVHKLIDNWSTYRDHLPQ